MKKLAKTIMKNGGATLQWGTLKNINVNKGYIVSVENLGITDLEEEFLGMKTDLAFSLIAYAMADLSGVNTEEEFLGVWVDKQKVHFDNVKIYADKNKALEQAKKLNELAIWDVENGKEIRL